MHDQLSSRGGVDIMDRHQLHRYDAESRRTLRKGISHFLSPQLQVLIKEKPRIALAEKADFAELLSEERSGRCIEELSMDLMRRSFMIRKRVAPGFAAGGLADEEGGGPPVPPDMPAALQTTNKLSPAFAKKVGIGDVNIRAPLFWVFMHTSIKSTPYSEEPGDDVVHGRCTAVAPIYKLYHRCR